MINYSKVKPIKNEVVDLFVEDCNLFAVFDAPVNIIFTENFITNINKFKDIFSRHMMPKNIFFSCKSNKSKALLKTASNQNCGIEVSSYYELLDALIYTNKIISSGPAKDYNYLKLSIEKNVLISVDDIEELKSIIQFDKPVRILLRISNLLNKISRFGINISQIDKCLEIISNSKIILEGFSFHINNYSLDERINAIKEILKIIEKKQIQIKYIDIGGGLPTTYCKEEDYIDFINNNNPNMYFKNKNINNFYPYYNKICDEKALDYILKNVSKLLNKIEIIIEPGRSLLNNVGISIYKIEYIKNLDSGDNLIITNGNINCLSEQWFNSDYLIEPKLYQKHKTKKLIEPFYASVCGNLCLEQDMITWRKIKFDYLPTKGDYLIYYNTAGYQMDSNESEFHKIPLVKKYIVYRKDNKLVVKEDEK